MVTRAKKFPTNPAHPERVCWGCDEFCPATDMRCGNGSDRTPHPAELFGDDWQSWGLDDTPAATTPVQPSAKPGIPPVPLG
jgi:hypothetical protein